MIKYYKILISVILIFLLPGKIVAQEKNFQLWLNDFIIEAVKQGISKDVVTSTMANARFLPKVIEYDRFQPEFYEDTKTYISKRTSKKKVISGLNFYKNNYDLINTVEKKYQVEKELLLALMGIETNFGTYV